MLQIATVVVEGAAVGGHQCFASCCYTYLCGLSFEESALSLGSLNRGLHRELGKGTGEIKCSSVTSAWIWWFSPSQSLPGNSAAMKVSEPGPRLVQAPESAVLDVPEGLWNNAVRLKHAGDLSLPGLRFLR